MDERRQHRRLAVRLPIECTAPAEAGGLCWRANATNISTGGLYFELDLVNGDPAPAAASLINIDLTVPPGEGHFPYEGRIHSTAEILRCDRLEAPAMGSPALSIRRIGVAARFREPLKLAF